MIKHCHCCGKDYGYAGWVQLAYVGQQGDLEMRNCPCGSTIAIESSDRIARKREIAFRRWRLLRDERSWCLFVGWDRKHLESRYENA